jgi:poly(A) polymerase
MTEGTELARPKRAAPRRKRSDPTTQSAIDDLKKAAAPRGRKPTASSKSGARGARDTAVPEPDNSMDLDLPGFEIREMPADLRELGIHLDAEPDRRCRTSDSPESGQNETTQERQRPAPKRHEVAFDDGRIDSDAARVVRRLTRSGFEAYLVGGCVRDLLLGFRPKDFDVATDASPDDVRRLFRNSRIIGRRFRLVHVLFGGGKVIETATFRRAPPQDDDREGAELLIRNDNEFGEAHEDALRRDFTVNGLFYDLDGRHVLDWVSGMPDIDRRTIHTIGDPVIRFQEDPIRMLRAIKFAARLDCGISEPVYDAIVQCRGSLAMAARPRLFEELLRLLRGGASHRSVFLAWEMGVLDVLLPELASFLSDQPEDGGLVWRMLQRVDELTKERGEPLSDLVLCCVLLLEPMLECCENSRDRMKMAGEFLEPVIDRLNVPRRIADAMRRIVALLPRLESGRGGRFQRTSLYVDASIVQGIRRDARIVPQLPVEEPEDDSQPEGRVAGRSKRRRRPRSGSAKTESVTEPS